MGIAVISTNAVLAPAATATPSAGATGEAAGGGFAALLTGQLGSALGISNLAGGLAGQHDTKKTEASRDDEADSSSPIDPSLALMLGNPALTQQIQQPQAAGKLGDTLEKDLLEKKSDAPGLTGILQAAGDKAALAASEKALPIAEGNDLPAKTANIAVDPQPDAAAAGLLAAGNRAQAAPAEVRPRGEVATPLHAANWSSDFGEKIVWLAKSEQQSAQLNLNPAQLGPVQITLQINGDQATAVFASPHAEVRQAIEDSLPQLRDMLSSAGINLGQADVGANMARQSGENAFQSAAGNRSSGENAILPAVGGTVGTAASQPLQHGRGLVDLFA